MVDEREAPWVMEAEIPVRFLEGKKGIVIDSVGGLPDYVKWHGGEVRTFDFTPAFLLGVIEEEATDFLIVHNYLVGDKDMLLNVREMGVEMLLLAKTIVAPEQEEEHRLMCEELEELGVSIGHSNRRSHQMVEFLKKVYGQDSSD